MSEASPETTEKTPLLFRWKPQRLMDWRLPFCLFAAIFGHAFAFYVFRVVYPPADQVVPRSTTVAILHEDNADARKLLHQLEDRIFFVWPGEGTEIEEWSPAKKRIEFGPSFQSYDISLRETPQPRWKLDQKSTDSGELMAFPAPEALPEASSEIDPAAVPRLTIETVPEQNRDYQVHEEQFRQALNSPTGRLRAYISVEESGRVRNWNELERSSESEEPDTFKLAQSIRFAPRPGEPLQWFWIEVHW